MQDVTPVILAPELLTQPGRVIFVRETAKLKAPVDWQLILIKDELWRRVFMRYLNIEKSTYTHLMPAELYGIQKMVHMSYRNKS